MRLILIFLSFFLSVSAWASQPFFVPKGSLEYEVERNGEIIGAQRVDFKNNADKLIVNTSSNISVTFFGVPIYTFDQTTEEIWHGGMMISYKANALDGSSKKNLVLHRKGSKLVGTYNGKKRNIPGNIISSVLWRVDATKANIILDAVNGKVKDTKAVKIGEDMVKVGDKEVLAAHYQFSGEFNREAWYDQDGHMVKAILTARDGSKVTQILKNIPN